MKNRAWSLQLLFSRRNPLHSSLWQRAAGLAGLLAASAVLGCAHQAAGIAARPSPGTGSPSPGAGSLNPGAGSPSPVASSPLRLLPPPPAPPLLPPLKTPPPMPPRPLAVTPEPPQSPSQSPSPAPPPEHETAAPAIPLHVLAGAVEPLHADDPTLPDQVLMASRGKVLQGSYKLCISRDGKVQSVTPVVGIEGVDRCVVETLKTWQFPKLPILLCKLQTLRFEIP